MDWKECCNKGIIKDVKLDIDMIKAIIESSKNKNESEKKLRLDEVTAASKVSLSYDSLRELLEALALKNRYKIYNHECYTPFLKEILNESYKADEFDEIRKIRNSIKYYGKKISIEEAERIINDINNLREFILKLLK